MIYFVCPDLNLPTGGIKQIYRQVDVLNNYGLKASVLHRNQGFRCNWFENSTVVSYNTEVWNKIELNPQPYRTHIKIYSFCLKLFRKFKKYLNPRVLMHNCIVENQDILVFPEIYGFEMLMLFPKNDIVIFNQNCFYTFNKYNYNDEILTYSDNLKGTIVASEYAFNYLNLFNKKVYKIKYGFKEKETNSIDKEKIISFMPRKLSEDVTQVIQLIRKRARISDSWMWIALDNMREEEVQDIMKRSAFFLSFSNIEGFGMPPVEAMLNSCVVIGYHGVGGKEYFNNNFCINIQNRDILEFVNVLEQHLLLYDNEPKVYMEMGKRASSYMTNHYSLNEEEVTIIKAWKEILNDKIY